MKAKDNKKNIRKISINCPQPQHKPSKHSSSFNLNDQIPVENNQMSEKQFSNQSLNQRIELIQKLIKIVQGNSIDSSIQRSLVGYLSNYSEILQKKIDTRFYKKNSTLQKNTASLYSQYPTVKNNDSFENQSRFETKGNNNLSNKLEKNTDKQNLGSIKDLRQNQTKILLPQINKNLPTKSTQRLIVEKENQLQEKYDKSDKKQTFLSTTKQENKSLSKTPKSRFFQLKNIDYSMLVEDQNLQNQHAKKNNPLSLFKIKPEKKSKTQHYGIVQGLKNRFGQHMILVGKLEGKIRELENKKLGIGLKKVAQNKLQKDNSINQYNENSCIEAKQNTIERNAEIQILKIQLLQRQQELKNLWIFLQQNQKHSCSLLE